MAPNEKDIDSLHQQASALYLQGEFQAALLTWRQLLMLDPDDERALEGVRLCEMLADDLETDLPVDSELAPQPAAEEGAAPTDEAPSPSSPSPAASRPAATPPAASAPAASPPSPLDAAEESFDELDRVLDLGGGGDSVSELLDPDAPEPVVGDVDPSKRDEPIVADAAAPAGGTAVAQAEAVEPSAPSEGAGDLDFDLSLDTDAAAAGDSPADESAGSSNAELRIRVNSLLAEALQCVEQGLADEALKLIARVEILDEENSAARKLREKIEARLSPEQRSALSAEEQPSAEGALEYGNVALPAGDEAEDEGESLRLDDVLAERRQPQAKPTVGPGETGSAQEVPAAAAAAAGQPTAADTDTVAPAKRKASGGRPVLIIGVAAVVLLGAGIAGWKLLGSGSAEVALTEAPQDAARTASAVLPSAGEAGATSAGSTLQTEAGTSSASTAPTGATALDELLGQARASFDNQDYAAAILAANRVLEADPGNLEARDMLLVAGDRYRAAKEIAERWEKAIRAFEGGNYRESLIILYRLPESGDRSRLDRYKRNGWYNMALQALQAGDCGTAVSHLEEARSIDPVDEGIRNALGLAERCRAGRRDPTYEVAVRTLGLRGLED